MNRTFGFDAPQRQSSESSLPAHSNPDLSALAAGSFADNGSHFMPSLLFGGLRANTSITTAPAAPAVPQMTNSEIEKFDSQRIAVANFPNEYLASGNNQDVQTSDEIRNEAVQRLQMKSLNQTAPANAKPRMTLGTLLRQHERRALDNAKNIQMEFFGITN